MHAVYVLSEEQVVLITCVFFAVMLIGLLIGGAAHLINKRRARRGW